ncbi:MAG: phosphoribosylaminoimidazolesuccinocarboxamide synthase [Euryarchaeota archaeon]|nr:phosphoribosylaminoimidazolesuccinocarboxamide synthase [Euryarchaeota archaeon]
MNLVRKGKVKEVYEDSADTLRFVFTDQISVFDKIIPTLVPFKGETLNRTSAHWFTIVEQMGVLTHYLEMPSASEMRVKRVEVITDYSKMDICTKGYLIPLEFICRHYVAGSLLDRVKSGKLPPEELGFPRGHIPKHGERLPQPFFEVTTKLEKVDRGLGLDEALKISGLTREEYEGVKETVLKIDDRIATDLKQRGLIHADGKKEFAFDSNRDLMIIDTFGTADEDRFWDAKAYDEGRLVELSKEFVRQHYRRTGYLERLEAARGSKKPEPPIPPLPDDLRDQVSRIYIDIFERLTGQKFG